MRLCMLYVALRAAVTGALLGVLVSGELTQASNAIIIGVIAGAWLQSGESLVQRQGKGD